MSRYIITSGEQPRAIEANVQNGFLVDSVTGAPLLKEENSADDSERLAWLRQRLSDGKYAALSQAWFQPEFLEFYIPKPSKKLVAQKLYEKDFNFDENDIQILLAGLSYLTELGEYKLAETLLKINTGHSVWAIDSARELQKILVADALRTKDHEGLKLLLPAGSDANPYRERKREVVRNNYYIKKRYWSLIQAAHAGNIEGIEIVFTRMHIQMRKQAIWDVFPGFVAAGNAEALQLILGMAESISYDGQRTLAHGVVRYKSSAAYRFCRIIDQENQNSALQDALRPYTARAHRKKTNSNKIGDLQFFRHALVGQANSGESEELGSPTIIEKVAPDIEHCVTSIHPLFSQSVYEKLFHIITIASKLENSQLSEKEIALGAYRIAVLFDNADKALEWMQGIIECSGNPHKTITAALNFDLPTNTDWNVPIWRQAVKAHGLTILKHTAEADKIEKALADLDKASHLEECIDLIAIMGRDKFNARIMEWKIDDRLNVLSEIWNKALFREATKSGFEPVLSVLDQLPALETFIERANVYRAEHNVSLIEIGSLEFRSIAYYVGCMSAVRLCERDYSLSEQTRQKVLHFFYTGVISSEVGEASSILISPCTLGVEIEFYGLNLDGKNSLDQLLKTLSPDWDVGSDSSISPDDGTLGVEVKSPILDNANYSQLSAAVEIIHGMGGKVKVPCALHVHAGINNVLPEELRLPVIKQALINYIALEDALTFMDSALVHRYEHTFKQQRISTEQAVERILRSTNIDDVMKVVQPGGYSHIETHTSRRRGKINLHAIAKYGTIEFRQHPGTTEPNEVSAWTRFVDRFMYKTIQMASINVHIPAIDELAELQNLVSLYQIEREPLIIAADYPKRSIMAQIKGRLLEAAA